ncbi:MAG TPA: PaaX family transcriptional regulator C-terminal domain-containing protein [Acidimicrobiales bacterium]|nr:PaaX family transcriptional regulator C-terminal domain-containing protein [Acidimicrobiales bacterium]
MTDVNRLSRDVEGAPGGPAARPPDAWTPLRREGGAPRARDLLLTVLGEFVLPGGIAVWTSALVDALGLLGVEQPAARQALARSSASGLLVAERVGRRTRWSLTGRATRLLSDGARRIYGFGSGEGEWDGRWLLVLVTVPEHNRHLRARLRARMTWLGFGLMGPGAWVTPWADREGEALAALEELQLVDGAVSWVGRPGRMGSLEGRVDEIWDLDALAGDYTSFVAAATSEAPAGASAEFVALTRLVHDWRHFPAADPGLPAALLPGSWPGPAAARTFHECHARWGPGARAWWEERADRG